jgi:putative endonuclease
MSFWVYMLHCNGGKLYVGHTDNLERRLWQHENGTIAGFTADYRPVKLIWSDYCETRDAAKSFELRLKGWSRAKKLALVHVTGGLSVDWREIDKAVPSKKDRPSTSSGKRMRGPTLRNASLSLSKGYLSSMP